VRKSKVRRIIATRLALAVAVMLGVAGTARAQNFDSPQRVDTTVSLERGGTLSVSVWSGRVNISAGSGSSVRVRGTVERDAMELRARSSSVSISMESEIRHGGRAELDIIVPERTNIVLEGYSAPYVVRGVKGAVQAETLSGSIRVSDAIGRVTLETVSGNIDVSGVDGDVRAETVSGSVAMNDVNGGVASE
jgi:hypothetical protein